jgi:hypothetical protein
LVWDNPAPEPEPEPEPIKPVPVYAENNKFRGPETPKFAYRTAPTPATYDQSLKVGGAGRYRYTPSVAEHDCPKS